MPTLHILYASTSGHTEYVVQVLTDALKGSSVVPEMQRVELATPEDLARGDVILLASGSWNTGGIEGQLNPHMYAYLMDRCAGVNLSKKKVLLIALGDDRYRYKANAAVYLRQFVLDHGGEHIGQTLKIMNEPYGQEESVRAWAKEILPLLS